MIAWLYVGHVGADRFNNYRDRDVARLRMNGMNVETGEAELFPLTRARGHMRDAWHFSAHAANALAHLIGSWLLKASPPGDSPGVRKAAPPDHWPEQRRRMEQQEEERAGVSVTGSTPPPAAAAGGDGPAAEPTGVTCPEAPPGGPSGSPNPYQADNPEGILRRPGISKPLRVWNSSGDHRGFVWYLYTRALGIHNLPGGEKILYYLEDLAQSGLFGSNWAPDGGLEGGVLTGAERSRMLNALAAHIVEGASFDLPAGGVQLLQHRPGHREGYQGAQVWRIGAPFHPHDEWVLNMLPPDQDLVGSGWRVGYRPAAGGRLGPLLLDDRPLGPREPAVSRRHGPTGHL